MSLMPLLRPVLATGPVPLGGNESRRPEGFRARLRRGGWDAMIERWEGGEVYVGTG